MSNVSRCPDTSFDKWFRQLKRMAVNSYGFEISESASDAWREYYDDHFSPREALDEDTYAGV